MNLYEGLVFRFDVSNLHKSIEWYQTKLNLERDTTYDTDKWTQFKLPGMRQVTLGLKEVNVVKVSTATPTLMVKDIVAARQCLIDNGVEVTEIKKVDFGVLLAFFKDFDGNQLGLRQNP